jgi:hypothetical protein
MFACRVAAPRFLRTYPRLAFFRPALARDLVAQKADVGPITSVKDRATKEQSKSAAG